MIDIADNSTTHLATGELPVRHPLAVPTGRRVYRRPSPPPSQTNRPRCPSVEPLIETSKLEAPQQTGVFLRTALVIAATTTAALMGVVIGAFILGGENNEPEIADAKPAMEVGELQSTNSEETSAEVASAKWESQPRWQDLLGESAVDNDTMMPTGAQLLASRFYDLETDAQGHIISARMPADGDNRRFGPPLDEIAALSELPHLQRLDLRNTIATAAVPIANRQANLKVLVLEDQSSAIGLRRLRGVEELHLVNSPIDADSLSEQKIKIVRVESP